MSANVETMFSVRETPWHGLGRIVMDAPASREALELAGLDWQVESRNIYSGTGAMIPGYRANVRSTDEAVLGVVSDRYRIVQNEEAFQFTDDLLGEGVTYETAGSLQGGKKVWMLAKLPEKYIIAGDEVTPYLVFFNSHDGSSGVKVAMTPVRVVCQNTLNLALGTAKRIWTARHTENVLLRVQDARETLQLANSYMGELGKGIHELTTIKLSDRKVPGWEPTKSGVVGLLAAALGLRRDEREALTRLTGLRFGVRVEREGQLLVDYHTAKTQDEKTSYVTYRHYLQDAVFLAGIESTDTALLQQLQQALLHPAFPLYLGRRCCPPTLPLCLGVRPGSLQEVLQAEPPLCPGRQSRILLDADPLEPGTAPQRDVPVSFDPHHRQYGYRSVRELWQKMPDSPETTEHDPFREL